jgi:hypothetical protein
MIRDPIATVPKWYRTRLEILLKMGKPRLLLFLTENTSHMVLKYIKPFVTFVAEIGSLCSIWEIHSETLGK